MELTPTARYIVANITKNCACITREDLRDACDCASNGELDAVQLDILTKMVEKRLDELRETYPLSTLVIKESINGNT